MDSLPPLSSMAATPIMRHLLIATAEEEDVCSICLDAFNSLDNPPTATTCKHEYHLQCILEWSQRSKECPICWQVIVLKDPTSQEILAAVGGERSSRSGLNVRHIYEDPQLDHRVSGVGPSRVHALVTSADVPIGQQMYASPEEFHNSGHAPSHADSITTYSTSTSIDQTSPFLVPSMANVVSQTAANRDYATETNQSPNGEIAADMNASSESVESKFSAASTRYKESISKNTRGLKEKLLARNSSVKELSKGVQREMRAGVAGFARMIERLDLASKRAAHLSNSDGENSNFSFKGKSTKDNGIALPLPGTLRKTACNVNSHVGLMYL